MKKILTLLKNIKNWFLRQSKIKKILIGVGIIIVLIIISQLNKQEEGPSYQFASVEKGDITQITSETGEVTTNNKTEIATTIDGVVTEVYVQNGDMVEKGDSLFYVDSNATQEERAQAYSSYLSAKNSLESAKIKLNTLESSMWSAHEKFEADALDTELSVDDPIYIQTQRDWLAAEATYLNQEEVIKQSQASVSNAWLAYQATVDGPVKATLDGQVANLAVAPGQVVSASDTASIIKTNSEIWLEVSINENDIVDVAPGQSANVELDALSDLELSATVQRVDEFATIVSDIAVYTVYLSLDQEFDQIRPGMTAQVDITTQEKTDILLVPNTAIKSYQGEKAVQIINPTTQTVIYKPVEIGISGDINTEIISGLAEGDQVIVSSTTTSDSSKSGSFFAPPGR